ncbi:MAG: hypothetical protein AABX54_04165 [Nanoarchaeota archaeon]
MVNWIKEGFRKGLESLLIAGTLAFGSGKADAGIMFITNATDTSSIGISTLTFQNIAGASEGYDSLNDVPFMPPIQTNALEIYTMVDGNKLMLDSRPVNTLGWDFYLGVKGSVSGIDNYFRYKVADTTDLSGKTLSLYDINNPVWGRHDLVTDGMWHNITYSANLSGSNTEYAHMGLDVGPETPEPGTIAMLVTGAAFAGGIGLYRHLRSRRRKEDGKTVDEYEDVLSNSA